MALTAVASVQHSLKRHGEAVLNGSYIMHFPKKILKEGQLAGPPSSPPLGQASECTLSSIIFAVLRCHRNGDGG